MSRSVVDVVRALTIKQPWAWAVAQGWKDIENRTWPVPKFMLGEWCAIHAGKEWDSAGFAGFAGIMQSTGRGDLLYEVDDVRGAVIAVARLDRDVMSNASPWFAGPHGFVWADVIKLPTPLECRGALSFWRLPFDVDGALRQQLEGMSQ